MKKTYATSIAVTSRTFSANQILRTELQEFFPNVRFFENSGKLEGADLVSFLANKPAAIIALNEIGTEVLSQLPKLKAISKYGVGLDNIDQEALKKFGVRLGWTGGVNRRAVAELALALMFTLMRKTFWHHNAVRDGTWQATTNLELSGKTVGILGCGFIGKDLSRILRALNCRVIFHDLLDMPEFCVDTGTEQVTKEELLRNADVVSVHLPYNSSTKNFLSSNEFSAMKPGGFLVNTCRGNVVDEVALLAALESGQIKAAASDVFSQEPPVGSSLIAHPNFIATPHIGGSTDSGVLAMGRAAISNLVKLVEELRL